MRLACERFGLQAGPAGANTSSKGLRLLVSAWA